VAAVRIRVPAARYAFIDEVFGPQGESLGAHTGDFIVRRRDGLFAYQLAVVVDDAAAHVSHVVRGADLLDNTPRQLFLMDQLGLDRPSYAHIPVITDRTGAKLSKQTFARAITPRHAALNLYQALALLGQEPEPELLHATPGVLLAWAQAHWRLDQVPAAPHFSDFVSI
jgi:glutamyl-Q tRNA(Asp) synthetase